MLTLANLKLYIASCTISTRKNEITNNKNEATKTLYQDSYIIISSLNCF